MKKIFLFVFIITSFREADSQTIWKATTAMEREVGEQRRKMLEKRSLIGKISFRNVGPSVMSGRVVDLDANPDNPSEFYVAYASGGLWYTKNNGQSFRCISDDLPHTFTGDVAVNWKEKIVWLGTGESNSLRSSYAGNGIYKTRDNGKTWEYLGLPESHHIGKVELHPVNPEIAWVAAVGHLYSFNKERGIYLTHDGGKTWKQTLYIDDTTGGIDVSVNPLNPDILYAAMWHRSRNAWNFVESGKTSGIYKSLDGGQTWKMASTKQSGFPTGEGNGRIGLAIHPKNPDILYAVLDNFSNRPDTAQRRSNLPVYTLKDFENLSKEKFAKLDEKKLDSFLHERRLNKYKSSDIKMKVAKGIYLPSVIADYFENDKPAPNVMGAQVYRSNDGGKTWKLTHSKYLDNVFSSYGYFFGRIWVSPINPDKVVIVGVPLMLSEDGGKTFKDLGKANVHVDHHAFWFNPKDDNHFINGNDGGVNISYDNGDTWFKANTPAVGQFYAVEVDNAELYNVYGGMQDNGVWYGPSTYIAGNGWYSNGQYPYKSIGGGDGMQVQVDWRNNKIMYAGSQFGAYFRSSLDGSIGRIGVTPIIELGEKPLRFNWMSPILLSRHNQDILYFGSNRFHRSMNKGEKMQNLSGDLTNGPKIGDVQYGTLTALSESPLRFGLLYAASDDGNIHISKDGGYIWTKISSGLPQGLWVTKVTASGFAEGRVYASLTGYRYDHFQPYLFVSEDFGVTWKQIGNDLPVEPVNVVKEDPKNENILYVGTDNGLYVTFDRGRSFMAWTGGLPRVPVYDLTIQERDNEIVLGTHGRSVYIAKLSNIQQLTPELSEKDLAILEVHVSVRAPLEARRRSFVTSPSLQISYFVKSGGMITINIKSEKDSTVASIKDTATSGINFAAFTTDLPAGDYIVEVLLSGGARQTKKFSVKSVVRQQTGDEARLPQEEDIETKK